MEVISFVMAIHFPICSMGMGIFTYIYHKFQVNVGKHTSPMEHLGLLWLFIFPTSLSF